MSHHHSKPGLDALTHKHTHLCAHTQHARRESGRGGFSLQVVWLDQTKHRVLPARRGIGRGGGRTWTRTLQCRHGLFHDGSRFLICERNYTHIVTVASLWDSVGMVVTASPHNPTSISLKQQVVCCFSEILREREERDRESPYMFKYPVFGGSDRGHPRPVHTEGRRPTICWFLKTNLEKPNSGFFNQARHRKRKLQKNSGHECLCVQECVIV